MSGETKKAMRALFSRSGFMAAAWMVVVGIMTAGAPARAADPDTVTRGDHPSAWTDAAPAGNVTHQEHPSDQNDVFEDEFDAFAGFEEFDDDDQAVFDPLRGYNRAMTKVNDRLYYLVLKPVGQGYKLVVAEPARRSISHFFTNLGFPVRFVNNLLQLKFERAATEVVRFIVNSSIGVAGLWDPATKMMELPLYDEDFGQTLGHYGLGGGFHIVLPLLGPSNLRDACGRIVDWPLNPTAYISGSETAVGGSDTKLAISTVNVVNSTSLRIGQYEALTEDAVDLYIFLREAYRQNRNMQIKE